VLDIRCGNAEQCRNAHIAMKKDPRKFPDFSDMFWTAFLQNHDLLASPSENLGTTDTASEPNCGAYNVAVGATKHEGSQNNPTFANAINMDN